MTNTGMTAELFTERVTVAARVAGNARRHLIEGNTEKASRMEERAENSLRSILFDCSEKQREQMTLSVLAALFGEGIPKEDYAEFYTDEAGLIAQQGALVHFLVDAAMSEWECAFSDGDVTPLDLQLTAWKTLLSAGRVAMGAAL